MKNLNNRILTIILLALIAVFVLTRIFRSPHLESNVATDLFQLDTATVTQVVIHPHKMPGQIKLVRKAGVWKVSRAKKTAPADQGVVGDMLSQLMDLRIDHMVSRKKSDWNTYAVGDTSGTHVTAYAGSTAVADFWIGETGTGTGPYRQNTSYVRMNSSPEVYQVRQGYLDSYFDKAFDSWRDRIFLKTNTQAISRINFSYPADSGFTAIKKDSVWMIGSLKADSAKMAGYLGRLQSQYLYTFADDFSPTGPADEVITLLDGGAKSIGQIKAWKRDKDWVLSSSYRPGIYFSTKGSDAVKDLLVPKKALLPSKKK